MTAIARSLTADKSRLRPLNIMRDLPQVANLVETCFAGSMDQEGKRFIQQMRKAGEDHHWLAWAANAVENTSLPLSGYVWEVDGSLVGNVSLIPYRDQGRKVFLIANIAVHPDHRRRGIARTLTEKALEHSLSRRAESTWLHVREDNPGAIQMYESLGFQEVTRRTHWQAIQRDELPDGREYEINPRQPQHWRLQKEWLASLYPSELNWYLAVPWNEIKPGLAGSIKRFITESSVQNWVVSNSHGLSATLTSISNPGHSLRLLAGFPANNSGRALTALLLHARRRLTNQHPLSLELPAGVATEALSVAGFQPQRTLIWMRLDKTNPADLRR